MSRTKSQPRVVVFTTPTCGYCTVLKRYLREKHIRFKAIDITKDESAAKDLARRGLRGVPVTLINNRPVVGFDKAKLNRFLDLR